MTKKERNALKLYLLREAEKSDLLETSSRNNANDPDLPKIERAYQSVFAAYNTGRAAAFREVFDLIISRDLEESDND